MISVAVCGLLTCFCYLDFFELGIQFYIDFVTMFTIKIDKNNPSNV
jgi:hypothetical protein